MSRATGNTPPRSTVVPVLPTPVRRVIERFYRVFRAERVFLFGSYARGQPSPRSDVDLLVVLPDEQRLKEATRRSGQLVAGLFPGVDLVLTTPRELAEARGERAAFLRSVMEHGVEQRAESPPAHRLGGSLQVAKDVGLRYPPRHPAAPPP